MFRYTTISIVFVVILFALIIQVQYEGTTAWYLVIPIVIYLAVLILGSTKIGLNFYFTSLCKGKTDEKVIALTFDDGPHQEITPKLLSVLDKHEVKASFFCMGKNISKLKNIAKEINSNGHLIGNHSYTHHRWFDLFSSKKMVAEIRATNAEIEKISGKQPLFFRPPYGVTNPSLRRAILKTDMYSIGWSLRSFDTVKPKESVLQKLKQRTKPGDVILMHDTIENVIEITDEYLKWLKNEGFKVVSLEQMFDINAYDED